MAEPAITLQINEGSEGTPTWTPIDTAIRWVGEDAVAGTLTDPHPAPVGDADEVFFDDAAAPNSGELWHDTTADLKITVVGRNANRNGLRANNSAADPTADAPEFSAYDDATDAGNRTNPTVWVLVGTAGSSNISQIRAVETTLADVAVPGAGWTGQVHDTAPGGGTSGEALDGDQTGEKEVCVTVLAVSANKTFNLAACLPHDAAAGLTTFSYAFTYTFV